MADTFTTSTTLANLLSTYFSRKALPYLKPECMFYTLCDSKTPLPKGEGTTVKWNRWLKLDPVSTTLSETAGNSLTALSANTISATIAQYGRGTKPTQLIIDTASLDTVQGTIDNLTDGAVESIDKVIQLAIYKNALGQNTATKSLSSWMSAVVSAFYRGTNTTYSNKAWGFPVVFGSSATRLSASYATSSTTAQTTSACFSVYSLGKALKALKVKNAMPFADGLFKAICTTNAADDIQRDPEWKDWNQKFSEGVKKFEKGQVGEVKRCRVYESNNNIYYEGNGATVAHNCHLVFVFGQKAYGVTELGGANNKGFEIIIKRPNEYDKSDPFNQFSTMTYKFTMVAKALNVSAGRTLICQYKK